uniref:Small ribosomal subunit protein uS3c n=1 Tax=Carteria sp. SAG 8-5 TaxID=1756294 RepID=A0A0S2LPG7_9CHLO|nr:ribosomal protein S3 [Carteria sp. SAG 8-5]
MGQKVHPVGFRVGITKPYQSQWFARFHKYQYSQTILEDRLLRQTLMTLFPKLLNPFLKKIKKREENTTLSPKITHIKIERGLIPYQIGIQIHAENCDIIKSAIDNLTVNKELLANLQKARRYLFLLKMKPSLANESASTVQKQQVVEQKKEDKNIKMSLRNKNVLQKRLRKRQEIQKSIMMIKKNGSRFTVIQKKNPNLNTNLQNSLVRNIATTSTNKTKNKIFNVFLNKTQKNFLKHLKDQMKYWNEQMQKKEAALLGYNKKWSLKSFENFTNKLKNKPIYKLTKLVETLEKKSLIKMDKLRNDFISSGPLSKAQTFGYYQILNFLKLLKEYIKKQRTLRVKKATSYSLMMQRSSLTSKVQWGEKAIRQRLNNVEDECRKIKFIEYLKGIVQKHRQDNIYYYLSTISDSRKNLRKIQQFTKRHAGFLFGLDVNSGSDTEPKAMRDQIQRVLKQPAELQEIFLKQIEKQRKISKENCELTPKISLKFYSAAPSVIDTKATIVADTIIDALEKRQAFRKVIKQAKRDLLKNPRVKGVKIQVAGRLNGAEIARTEWVRSGRVPLQTLTANIDYSYKTANTIYGIIGIKVWIFKGYTKTINR